MAKKAAKKEAEAKEVVIDCYAAAGDLKEFEEGLPATLNSLYELYSYDTIEEVALWCGSDYSEEDKVPVKLQIVVRRIDE